MCPIITERTYWPISGTDAVMRCLSLALTSLSFLCQRWRIVCLRTTNLPLRVFAQLCVNPRKLKVSGLPSPRLCRLLRLSAKLDQTRLLAVKFQPKALEPFHKLAQKLLPVLSVLKSHNEVVGKPHHDHISSDLYSSPLLDPQVKHIVQVDIGQKRTDAPALDRPPLHLSMLPLLQHPSLEPLLDQPYYPPIRHPVLDKFHHPFMIQRIEETPNVGIEHPVHFPLHDPN